MSNATATQGIIEAEVVEPITNNQARQDGETEIIEAIQPQQPVTQREVAEFLMQVTKEDGSDQSRLSAGIKQLLRYAHIAMLNADKKMAAAISQVLVNLWSIYDPARKLMKAFDEINSRVIEREEELRCALTAVLARHHCLFVGAPGTAKSMLIKMIAKAFQASAFTIHGTKFLEPDFVFGPIDVVKLGQAIAGHTVNGSAFDRLTDGMALDSEFVIFEEVFRASPAVLDTFLLMMEPERKYREGGVQRVAPMISMFGASNSFAPEGCQEAVAAFSDRFAIRKVVKPIVGEAGRRKLRFASEADLTPVFDEPLSIMELAELQQIADQAPFSESAIDALDQIHRELLKEGIKPSDRRQRWAIGISRAAAVLEGSPVVNMEHLEILKHVLWDDPNEQPSKTAQIVAKIANPLGAEVAGKLAEFEEQIAQIQVDKITPESISAMNKLKNIKDALKKLPSSKKVDDAVRYMESEEVRIRQAIYAFK